MKHVDPDRMAPAERLAELAELLACAVQRHLARESKAANPPQICADPLDDRARAEAPCRAMPTEVA
jgi:hypothetical protein